MAKQSIDQMEHYKRANRELDDKLKSSSNKIVEVEGQLDLSRSQLDKHKRNLESVQKELSEWKDREKNAKRSLKNKEQETITIES